MSNIGYSPEKEYQRDYMRNYREIMKVSKANAAEIALWNRVFLRDSIKTLIISKYEISQEEWRWLLGAVYNLVKSRCPHNNPDDWDDITYVHLFHYYHTGIIPDIFGGKIHPSLILDLSEFIEKLELEVKKK